METMEFLSKKPLLITDTILRDAHQSQAATRMTIDDMLPAPALQGVVADGVQNLQGGEHVVDGHTGRGLGLVRVTEDGIRNQKRLLREKFHCFH